MAELFYDRQHDILLYRGAHLELERICGAVQAARRINGEYVGVPRTLQNSQSLRLLGLPVLPVMDGYDWPAAPGIKPYESQKLTANFLVVNPRSFVLSDLGTGKTLSALWAMDWLMQRHAPGTFRALIVCPLSTMEKVWGDAIFKNFLSKRSVVILYGDAEKRRKLLRTPADVYLINHSGLGIGAHTRKRFELDGLSRDLAERADIRVVIADEASAYRDAQTKRHRVARHVIGKRDYLWMLTATPTPNAPTDAYGLAKLVNNAFGKSFQGFQLETMYKPFPQSFRWLPQKDGYEKARRILTPSIRVDITDVWDGPPKTTQQRMVALTDQQKTLLDALKRDMMVVLKSGQTITPANEAGARLKFLQIVMGAVYDEEHKGHSIDAEPRYSEIESIVEQSARKIVCFAPLTTVIKRVYDRLAKKWGCAVINGNVSAKDRASIITRFATDDSLRVVICDPACAAHGINEFVHADTAIWVGPTDKNELYEQGNGRIHRPGQKYPTTVVQMIATNLEKEIFARLENQTSLQGALLDAVRRGEL